jgi:WD40 repeat protein
MPQWWDLRAATNALWSVEIENAVVEIEDAVFSPDGRLLATASGDGEVQVWLANGRKLIASMKSPEGQSLRELVFSPDGSRLAVTYPDHTIGLWDTSNGALVGYLTGHKQPAFSIAFSPDGGTLASAGADSTLRLWNVATLQELIVNRRLGANLRNLLFAPSGTLLVGGGSGPDAHGIRFFRAPFVENSEVLSRRQEPAFTAH